MGCTNPYLMHCLVWHALGRREDGVMVCASLKVHNQLGPRQILGEGRLYRQDFYVCSGPTHGPL